jgi:hypothetical protein
VRLFEEAKDEASTTDASGKPGIEGANAAAEARAKEAEAAKAKDAEAAKAKDVEAAKAKDAEAAKAAQVPEKYEFKPADGSELPKEVVDEFSSVAKEDKLTQERANKYFAIGQKLVAQRDAAFAKHVSDTRAKWVEEIKADPVLGANLPENLAVAKKAIAAADTDGALVKWLDESGAGDNPTLVRAFYKLGKMISNDKLVTSQDRKPLGNSESGVRTFSYSKSDHK